MMAQMRNKALAKWLSEHGVTTLARRLGITQPAVSQWKQTPPKRVLDIERITGISRHVLRPDIFGSTARANRGDPPVSPLSGANV
jgi:DNA-binding transcriptional regulator YdaS (Cro superfamily)